MKQAVLKVIGQAALLLRDDIDTDAIFPAEYLKTTVREGMRAHLFADWVRADKPEVAFLRMPQRVSILVVPRNFGCGSSREHAVWALADQGIQAVVALSFGDIFRNNCVKNDVLAAVVTPHDHARLCGCFGAGATQTLALDVAGRNLQLPDGSELPFHLAPGHAEQLMSSEDDIARTLRLGDALSAYEARVARRSPWLSGMD